MTEEELISSLSQAEQQPEERDANEEDRYQEYFDALRNRYEFDGVFDGQYRWL